MVSTLPGLKENPEKQFDAIGAELKKNFSYAVGLHRVHDKALESARNVSAAIVGIETSKDGSLYFEVTINLKKPVNGYRQFAYQLWFNKRGVCSRTSLPEKFKNKSNPYPLNYSRMLTLIKRNKKQFDLKMKKTVPRVAEK